MSIDAKKIPIRSSLCAAGVIGPDGQLNPSALQGLVDDLAQQWPTVRETAKDINDDLRTAEGAIDATEADIAALETAVGPVTAPDNAPSDGDVATWKTSTNKFRWQSFNALLSSWWFLWFQTLTGYTGSGKTMLGTDAGILKVFSLTPITVVTDVSWDAETCEMTKTTATVTVLT